VSLTGYSIPTSALIKPVAVIVPHDVIFPVPSTNDVPVIAPAVVIAAVGVVYSCYLQLL
jgi:hypothetical protein